MRRIAIVGGGASAVCLLDALAQSGHEHSGTVTVFEPGAALWRGRAYRVDTPAVRVNSEPEDMSVRAGHSGHLREWMAERSLLMGEEPFASDPRSGGRFVSRALYGDYLEQSGRRAIGALERAGWAVEVVRSRVRDIALIDDEYRLESEVGTFAATDVVLAVGSGPPPEIAGLGRTAEVLHDPYPAASKLASVPSDASVIVRGSGLTAVDVVLALRGQGHRGAIHLLSRSGALPAVRQRRTHFTLNSFSVGAFTALRRQNGEISTSQVIESLRQEVKAHGGDFFRLEAELRAVRSESAVDRLRRHLSKIDGHDIELRLVQQAVPEVGPDIWPYLRFADRASLLRHHLREMMSICCPMPPQSAAALLDAIDSGAVDVRGGLRGITSMDVGPGFLADVGSSTIEGDVVVNATNARLRTPDDAVDDLQVSLVARGLATSHPHGGLTTRRSNSRVDSAASGPALYAIGDAASGSLFFTFGIESLVDRAVDIVADIAASERASRGLADHSTPREGALH